MNDLALMAACLAAALICSAIRPARPEMATVLSLAVGVAVALTLLGRMAAACANSSILTLTDGQTDIARTVFKAAGTALAGELGEQICADAGERALAGRVSLIARAALLMQCLPLLQQIAALTAQLLV